MPTKVRIAAQRKVVAANVMLENRAARDAATARLEHEVARAATQRDSAVAALEVIAAGVSALDETPVERSYRLLAASALRRVEFLGRVIVRESPRVEE